MSRKVYLKHKAPNTNNLLMQRWHFCITFDVMTMMAGKNQAALAVCAQTKVIFPFNSWKCMFWDSLFYRKIYFIFKCHSLDQANINALIQTIWSLSLYANQGGKTGKSPIKTPWPSISKVEQIRWVFDDNWRIIFVSSPQKHVVGTHWVLMSTHNFVFMEK